MTTTQTSRFDEIIQKAIEGYKARVQAKTGAEATTYQVAAFAAKIGPEVQKSIDKAAALNGNVDRTTRIAAVKAAAASLGLKFMHNRDLEEVASQSGMSNICRQGFTEHIRYDIVNATLGGTTLAFKYALDDANNLSMVYSTAFCRNDENFDPLIGMEESLKKFQAGQVLTTPISHEKFGKVKLDQLSDSFKVFEENAKAFNDRAIAAVTA